VNLRAVRRGTQSSTRCCLGSDTRGGVTLTRRAIYGVNRASASPGLRVRQAAPAGEAIKGPHRLKPVPLIESCTRQ
jgi:hypothetical protein